MEFLTHQWMTKHRPSVSPSPDPLAFLLLKNSALQQEAWLPFREGSAGMHSCRPPIETREMPPVSLLAPNKAWHVLIPQQSDKIRTYLCLSNVWLGHGVPHRGCGPAPSERAVTIVTVPFY